MAFCSCPGDAPLLAHGFCCDERMMVIASYAIERTLAPLPKERRDQAVAAAWRRIDEHERRVVSGEWPAENWRLCSCGDGQPEHAMDRQGGAWLCRACVERARAMNQRRYDACPRLRAAAVESDGALRSRIDAASASYALERAKVAAIATATGHELEAIAAEFGVERR